MLESLRVAPELYFDSISRADLPDWSSGRIALVGDAACGATIGGMGTGTGIVAAYVLAGELALAGGDHRAAFPAYQRRLRDYARACQKGGDRTGRFLAPKSRTGARIRNSLLSRPAILAWMLKEGEKTAELADLPDYPAALGSRAGVPQRQSK
jgi:2-polyprenyl-6-methoxyphenol hydroxylase-like FAD-dependent oxidoreductase